MTRRPSRTGAARAVRGGLLAISSSALAVTAHAVAGGGMPDVGLTVLLTLLVGWIGTTLADRTSGPLPLLGVLGAAQLTLHLLLDQLIHTHEPALPAVGVNGAAMTGAHTVATVLTALVLARAEAALLAIAAALRLALPVLRRPVPVPRAPVLPVAARPERAADPFDVLLRRVCARRGPPATS